MICPCTGVTRAAQRDPSRCAPCPRARQQDTDCTSSAQPRSRARHLPGRDTQLCLNGTSWMLGIVPPHPAPAVPGCTTSSRGCRAWAGVNTRDKPAGAEKPHCSQAEGPSSSEHGAPVTELFPLSGTGLAQRVPFPGCSSQTHPLL